MVKQNRRKRRNSRRVNNTHIESAVFLGPASPATTVMIGYAQIQQYVLDRPFKFKSIIMQAAALDSATANKLTLGPAHFQIRQLGPVPVVSTTTVLSESSIVKSSRAFMVGLNPKTFRFNPVKCRYPANCKLQTFIAIDILCPQAGYEIGIQYNITVVMQIFHEYEAEKCPNKLVAVPTSSFRLGTSSQVSEPGFVSV